MKFSRLAILASVLFFILATVWMIFPEQLLALWGIESTPGTNVLGRRSAAFFAGTGAMYVLARNAEPSPTRYALATGISTISFMLAVSGLFEWYKGHVNGQILFAVFIELLLGTAFLLSNIGIGTRKINRINNK
ncbi:hypothetical protein [Klebsiella oxytoca]|uniref:hypothetical protein n=1 Tax=Enterobacteriaceae TaxID=543 RepID=UPI002FD015BE